MSRTRSRYRFRIRTSNIASMSTTKAKSTVKPSQLPLAAWAPSMRSYSAEPEVLLRSGGRTAGEPSLAASQDRKAGRSWTGEGGRTGTVGVRMTGKGEMRRWPRSTRSRRGRAPQSQTSAASHISLRTTGERGFDAASYDVAVWAGHGKGDQAGARRSLRIVSDPCDSCRTKAPGLSVRRSTIIDAYGSEARANLAAELDGRTDSWRVRRPPNWGREGPRDRGPSLP